MPGQHSGAAPAYADWQGSRRLNRQRDALMRSASDRASVSADVSPDRQTHGRNGHRHEPRPRRRRTALSRNERTSCRDGRRANRLQCPRESRRNGESGNWSRRRRRWFHPNDNRARLNRSDTD